VSVDVVRPDDLGAPERSRWRQLQAMHPVLSSPFLSLEYAIAAGRARSGTRVAVLSDSTDVVGFFPFERTHLGFGAALAKGLSDIQAVVAPPTADIDIGAVIRACHLRVWAFDHLLADQRPWLNRAPHRLVLERSWAIDVAGGWDAYESAQRMVSSSVFQSTARKRRKLERDHGPVRLVMDESDHVRLEELLRWKSDQYRRTGRRDRFSDAGTRALVHDLLDVRERGFGAPLTVLRAGDTIVAAHLGLRSTTTLAWWFPVYNPGFGSYSPGLLMCIELARAMTKVGLLLLDLGKGDERYKERLSNTEIPLLSGFVARDELTARINAARRWPRGRAARIVLRSPTMRAWARSTLNHVGAIRERGARRRGQLGLRARRRVR
jgi:CelD/BcsL family acetyltransferase involved in cellulose biosynthesis